jgi:hypothetical protein
MVFRHLISGSARAGMHKGNRVLRFLQLFAKKSAGRGTQAESGSVPELRRQIWDSGRIHVPEGPRERDRENGGWV